MVGVAAAVFTNKNNRFDLRIAVYAKVAGTAPPLAHCGRKKLFVETFDK